MTDDQRRANPMIHHRVEVVCGPVPAEKNNVFMNDFQNIFLIWQKIWGLFQVVWSIVDKRSSAAQM
jgi:hypothetical protein